MQSITEEEIRVWGAHAEIKEFNNGHGPYMRAWYGLDRDNKGEWTGAFHDAIAISPDNIHAREKLVRLMVAKEVAVLHNEELAPNVSRILVPHYEAWNAQDEVFCM